jgi:hypothetical protein
MAKAPSAVASWDGSGDVWFKVYQISAVTDGGSTITFPAQSEFFGENGDDIDCDVDQSSVSFKIPSALPSGDYLVRVENIAIHSASYFGGAQVRLISFSSSIPDFHCLQFYLACAQVTVTGGGSGTPGPLVSIPGVYTGNVSKFT